ncbi:MAG TPA: S9 family peptidase [Pyrinomonadaceae bacterium]|jgi:dipeptidyl aminopeptidase/acylaminoacyl peptidase
MKKLFSVVFLCVFLLTTGFAQTFTIEELLKVRRVGDPQLSPDGRTIAFTVGDVDKAANRVVTQIYTVSIDGANIRQITKGDKSNSSPRWSPDGRKIAFTTSGQIWTMDADGDDKKQITKISSGAGNPVWSPDGKWFLFNSDVYPECASDDCNQKKDEANDNGKVKAIVTERLLYRHWVEWRDKKRSHVFLVSSNGSGTAADLTIGDFDAPPVGASTGVDYAFSPDSKEIVFLRNPDKIEAISTNSDIYVLPIEGNRAIGAKNITASNKGYDNAPAYTPDGKYIIYRSQAAEAFEADRGRIMRYNRATGETIELTRGFDLQVDEHIISADGKTVYFTAGQRGNAPVFSVPVEPDFRLKTATFVKPIFTENYAGNLNVSRDEKTFVFLSSSMSSAAEVMKANADGSGVKALTKFNSSMNLSKGENVDWTGALNAKVHGFLLKPANFDPSKKYPLLVLIHGGPQSAWNNSWGYRWNPQVFANAGYVVFMPNPRGSTGYGQKFVNEVSGDWGGRAYTDIMNGVAGVLKNNAFIDKTRIGAAGASYGGYMVDWILGHNNDPRFKFRALVSHAGVYNLESMAGATEELWFVNWEFKGMPWQNKVNYEKWSPNKFVANFKTPTLVTAGELDYRVPVDQDYQLFTALQLNDVDSKLIVFPDEGHWILKPQNSEFWYAQVLDWFGKYLNP